MEYLLLKILLACCRPANYLELPVALLIQVSVTHLEIFTKKKNQVIWLTSVADINSGCGLITKIKSFGIPNLVYMYSDRIDCTTYK